jgi:hypothetical protein
MERTQPKGNETENERVKIKKWRRLARALKQKGEKRW